MSEQVVETHILRCGDYAITQTKSVIRKEQEDYQSERLQLDDGPKVAVGFNDGAVRPQR